MNKRILLLLLTSVLLVTISSGMGNVRELKQQTNQSISVSLVYQIKPWMIPGFLKNALSYH
ncbi:hypothetical protein [Proteiniphilum sp.]|uniref:hypothetical protein n=1 Tax=Proteiniphilum sp. TaxID=1926877 RepID=UPI002B20B02E|nr:hypothetical protein [Proteiniphilum sp.]MEA4918100.1 hypothetical protein [Proteiniphilum sp.]